MPLAKFFPIAAVLGIPSQVLPRQLDSVQMQNVEISGRRLPVRCSHRRVHSEIEVHHNDADRATLHWCVASGDTRKRESAEAELRQYGKAKTESCVIEQIRSNRSERSQILTIRVPVVGLEKSCA